MGRFFKLRGLNAEPLIKNKLTAGLKVLFVLIGAIVFAYILYNLYSIQDLDKVVAQAGFWGPLIIIFYITLSHVVAPLSGSIVVVPGLALYGAVYTMILIYVASMMSATINFWLSRKFGRKWVEKIVNKESIDKIDSFTEKNGVKALLLGRLVGWSLFDVVSYASGLTKIDFKKYMLITATAGFVPNILFMALFSQVDFRDPLSLIAWYGFLIALSTLFAIILKLTSR